MVSEVEATAEVIFEMISKMIFEVKVISEAN